MKQFDRFIFDKYEFDPASREIRLHYALADSVSDMHFMEKLILPKSTNQQPATSPPGQAVRTGNQQLQHALFALHLIGGISYYKTCLPKTIEIRSGALDEKQAAFWNAVYENGLGEFFYKNNIDFRGLVKFPLCHGERVMVSGDEPRTTDTAPRVSSLVSARDDTRLLVPIGGGKDSIVTIELLKKAGSKPTLLRMGHHPLIEEEASIAGLPLITLERHLSPLLFKLNEEGALNGHVPITAYLSIVSLIVAMLDGFDAVVMSNERSANIGNVMFKGMEINHQWSKSLAFERMFQEYLRDVVGTPVEYFSLLRPLSELHIAKIFSQHPRYFGAATSCNTNWKILKNISSPPSPPRERVRVRGDFWCKQCPKCAFVFACLAAFLPVKTMTEIFGGNLFMESALLPLYRQLLGIEGFKPFECVGTPEETSAAFLLAHQREDFKDTAAMNMFVKEVLPKLKNPDALINDALTPAKEHAIPPTFLSALPFSS